MSDAFPELHEVNRGRSAEIAKIAAALCKAQAAMGGAKKDSTNPHFKNAYADLASIWEAVRKPLTDNGLAVVQFPRTVGNGVEVETMLVHASGEYMRDVLWLPVLKMDAQGVGSAITYGRRYALMSVTGIAPIDDDGNAASEHKPGPAGMASGGTDFRPDGPRRMPTQSSANGRRMANDDAHLVDDERAKGTTGKPPEPDDEKAKKIAEKSKAFVDRAINTLRLSGQSVETIKRYRADNNVEIEYLERKAPAEHDRFFEVYNEVLERARALAGV
jgi:hypothetical protein